MPKQGGKIFDINNLDQAKQLVSEINNLLDKPSVSAKQWMSDNEKIIMSYKKLGEISNKVKQIDESSIQARSELFRTEMNKLQHDIDLQDKFIKNEAAKQVAIEKTKNAMTEQINNQKQLDKEIDNTAKKLQDYGNNWKSTTQSNRLTFSNVGDKVFGKQISKREQQNQEQIQTITESVIEKHRNAGTLTEDNYENIKSEVDAQLGKDFKDGTKTLKLGAQVLNTAGQALKDGINRVFSLFKQGLTEQSNLYEQTFHNISTRTGIGRSDYLDAQRNTDNQLGSMGLYDNIKVTEVQQMWQDLANTGMNQQDMFSTAIDNVITQKIVPYLDTTSQVFNALNNRLDGKFVKDIRGINKANLDIAGNNYSTNEMLDKIITQMEPLTDAALQDLAKGSEEFTTMVNKLQASKEEGGMGLTKAQAEEYAMKVFKAQNYQDTMLSSGSVYDKLFITNLQQKGINVEDSSQLNNALGEAIDSSVYLNSMLPGTDNATNSLLSAHGGSALGLSRSERYSAQKVEESGTTGEQLANQIDEKVKSNHQNWISSEENRLKNGETQTLKETNDTTLENIMTDVATIRESLGEWSVIAESLLGGLGTLLTGKFLDAITGGKIGSWLGGIFGSSKTAGDAAGLMTGSKGILAGAGGIALSAVAVSALAIAVGSAVADKMWSSSGEHGKEEAEKELSGTSLQDNSAAQSLLATANAQMDAGKFQETFGNVGSGISMAFSNMFQGKSDKNKNFLQWAIQSGALSTGDRNTNLGYLLTLAAIYAQNGYLDSFNKGLNEAGIEGVKINNNADIGNAMIELGMTKDTFDTYKNNLFKAGWANINTEKGGTLKSFEIDSDKFGIKGQNGFRQGLDEVPYDGYKAVLHEGEAVLTSGTANEMRDLVDEYRDTNDQKANFQVVIESQTTSILAKMDDIIEAITSSNGGTVQKTAQQQYQSNKSSNIKNSMINLRSSRQFG